MTIFRKESLSGLSRSSAVLLFSVTVSQAPSPPLPLRSCTSQPLFPTLRIKLDQVLRNHTVSVVR